jgi:adenosylhomocysteinase
MNFDLSIMKALKIGKVPMQGTQRLAVGRDPEIAEMSRVMDYVGSGGFEVRFLRGDYGSGKTFFCSVVRELAFERGFAVSIVNLSREVPFGKRELVVGEIVRGLRSPTSGASCAFGEYVQRWFDKYDPASPVDDNPTLREAVARIANADSGMTMGLRAFHAAYIDGNEALMEGALGWLRGDVLDQDIRRALRVVGKLTADSAFRRLRGIIALLKDAGAPGLVVLLDEAEAIFRLGNSPQRLAAYTAIRELIDTGDVEFPYSFFLFAATPELFEDEYRGIASYGALYQRIRSQQLTSERDLRQPIIRLEELNQDGLRLVSLRVRDLHGSAYEYDAKAKYSDLDIDKFILEVGTKFGDIRAKPRTFLKALVDVLDAREQGLDSTHILDHAVRTIEEADATLDDVVLAQF